MLTLYGIKNCDKIQKTRNWLSKAAIIYQFHDYRVDGLNTILLKTFIDYLGWVPLLNTRSLTWRQLSTEQRTKMALLKQTPQTPGATAAAQHLMLMQPTLIKRPLLQATNGAILLGFSALSYKNFFTEVT